MINKNAQFISKYLFFVDVFVNKLILFSHAFEKIVWSQLYQIILNDHKGQSFQTGFLFFFNWIFRLLWHFVGIQNWVKDFNCDFIFREAFQCFHFGVQFIDLFFHFKDLNESSLDSLHLNLFFGIKFPKLSDFIENLNHLIFKLFMDCVEIESVRGLKVLVFEDCVFFDEEIK